MEREDLGVFRELPTIEVHNTPIGALFLTRRCFAAFVRTASDNKTRVQVGIRGQTIRERPRFGQAHLGKHRAHCLFMTCRGQGRKDTIAVPYGRHNAEPPTARVPLNLI
ncbi:MAG TPA: hypothetical protein VHV31_09975 [Nitrolancea sp.]|nr:hypothetical protein [Nitrolancea sp.]